MTWRDKLAQKANGMLPAGEYGMYLKRELLEIVAELDRLTAERDEARQMYCNVMTDHCEEHEARQIAQEQGWDCFKEDGK
jgi:uncharacterized coiled-coil DUF342 family protein